MSSIAEYRRRVSRKPSTTSQMCDFWNLEHFSIDRISRPLYAFARVTRPWEPCQGSSSASSGDGPLWTSHQLSRVFSCPGIFTRSRNAYDRQGKVVQRCEGLWLHHP